MESLWRAMESQLPQPIPVQHRAHPNPHHCERARASPPPDPELGGNGYHYANGPPPQQFSAASMQPPRLQQSSCCSRLLLMSGCCLCLMVVLVLWTAVISLPVVVQARDAFSGSFGQVVPAGVGHAQRPLPAVLHRFAMIRRVQKGQGRGADDATLRQAFPHWRNAQGELVMESVVGDVAMGLAAVVEHLDPSMVENRAHSSVGRLPAVAPPAEPRRPNAQSVEDTESTEL